MEENSPQGKICNSDRSQRRSCRYYHEKTGRCTMDPARDKWQEKQAKEQSRA